MSLYKIEQKITTIIDNAGGDSGTPSFSCNDIVFTHGKFTLMDAWVSDYWYATLEVDAGNFRDAYSIFAKKLAKTIPRISLIGQCYISFTNEPFLITRKDKYDDIGYFKFIRNVKHVGLMFMNRDVSGLNILLNNTDIPDSFYYYWNDAVNTIGYSSKLLLMFSAIENLAKLPDGKKDWVKVEKILGKELKDKIYTPNSGLRHRLTHGEYFNTSDSDDNYLDLIHKKVISYFNQEIFKSTVIDEAVVNPQRSPFDNKEQGGPYFIRNFDPEKNPFTLENIIKKDKNNNEEVDTTLFEFIYGDQMRALDVDF